MRILFHGPGTAVHRPVARLPHLTGVQHGTANRLSDLKATQGITSNRGNLIHAEAPARIFRMNRARSAYGNISFLQEALGDDFPVGVARNFDLVVFSMANFIAPGRDLTAFSKALGALRGRVPFIVLGAGLQGRASLAELHPSVCEVISIFDEDALLFGVRGDLTKNWLHSNGLSRARALGCPSLYTFPRSLMALQAPPRFGLGNRPNIITAGYLAVKGGRNFPRGVRLATALRNHRASYVFQDEFFEYGDIINTIGGYNDATNTADRETMNALLSGETGVPIDFRNYYYFSETSAWRQVASSHDIFVGDRFHGGVAALQAARPALFLCHDNRVAELTDFFSLPRMTTDELVSEGVAKAIHARVTPGKIAQIQKTYRKRLEDFTRAVGDVGIKICA